MKVPTDLGTKFRDRIMIRYPQIDETFIPNIYDLIQIDYRSDDIKKYHGIFWHRLLKRIYQGPSEIECEFQQYGDTVSFRKTQETNKWAVVGIDESLKAKIEAGEIVPSPVNWKYLIKLPSGGILELGTRDRNTAFYISKIVGSGKSEKEDNEEVIKFVDLLLEEANRLGSNLFHPIKDFGRKEGLKLYLLFNVYLSNYLSGEAILDIAESQEAFLKTEALKYDARTSDYTDENKRKHIDRSLLTCGTYFCSAITYFFMALEGFINLVFHVFLKNNLRDNDFNIEQRFDLEQKLRLMASLCNGFKEDSGLSSTIFSKFKTLKKYRNSLFHSKVEESLKSLVFVEDGFVYTYNIDQHKDRFFSLLKPDISINDVIEVKKIVDEIVHNTLNLMDGDTKIQTREYILKDPAIRVIVTETGDLILGTKDEKLLKTVITSG
jgi:hypothetical protein